MTKSGLLWLFIGGIVSAIMLILVVIPTMAAPQPQYTAIPTPTPGPDGRIIYIVQEGDTLWRISAITGITLDELRRLNNLGEGAVIVPGDRLLLGLGGPSNLQPTEGPAPTPTSALPTSTSLPGFGVLCISVFEDLNGDALRQDEELDLDGSAISISKQDGTLTLIQGEGGGLVPRCYEDVELGIYDIPGSKAECLSIVQCSLELEQGEYNISVGVPDGYNATTNLNHQITLAAGYQEFLDFGAQPNTQTIAEAPAIPEGGEGRSPMLAIIGISFLVIGIALGLVAFFIRK
jgi:hypothetical protein